MPITVIPAPPLRSQGKTQDQYSSEFEAFAAALPLMAADFNAAATLAQQTTTTTSSSSVTLGTGSKTFIVPAGLGFSMPMALRIGNSSTAYANADVTSYSGTTLIVNVTSIVGSGTFASWSISLAAVGANVAGSVSVTPAGNISSTNVQSALQELDTEKLSSAAGAVTGTNLASIKSAETVGSSFQIPVVSTNVNGLVTSSTSAAKIVSGTTVATTSGTSIDFTGIPAGVKRITLMFNGVSTSGTSIPILQIGNTTPEVTGYLGCGNSTSGAGSTSANQTIGFAVCGTNAAANVRHGAIVLTTLGSNIWVAQGVTGLSNTTQVDYVGGSKTTSGTIDRIRLTTVNGTDTFDAGSINIIYE